MKTDASLGDAVVAIALFTSIGAILVGCLSCRKKDKIVQTKNSFYEHQQLYRNGQKGTSQSNNGGRRITVTRSKRVTHFNRLCESSHAEIGSNANDHPSVGTAENQFNYENVLIDHGISEPAYVRPIGEGEVAETSVYLNTSETDQDIPDYENVFIDTTACQQSEYANYNFVEDNDATDEADYVNG